MSDPIRMVQERNHLIVDRYRKMILAVVIMGVAVIAMAGVIVYLAARSPEPRYFAQNSQGGLTEIVPLNTPNQSLGAVLSFASDSVLAVNSYDFANYRRQLTDGAKYFTPNGWKRYQDELTATNTLEDVVKGQMVVSSAVSGAPILEREGEIGGVKFWDVQVPFVVRFQSEKINKTLNMVSLVKVVRVSPQESDRGIAVAQFIVKQARTQ